MIFSFVNAPFPVKDSVREKILIAFLVGFFVGLFLFLFKPFGMDADPSESHNYKYIGFGIVSFLGMIVVDIFLPAIFVNFFREETYTVKKEIMLCVITIVVIALGNMLYLLFLNKDVKFSDTFLMLWQTLLVGIFPLTVMTLMKYNSLLKSNLKASAEINIESPSSTSSQLVAHQNPSITLATEKESKVIDLSDLLYIESVGNYVNVTTNKEGELSRNLFRKTLKSIVEDTTHANVMRCHRSYIINLDQVIEVNGNAQGLKLSIKGCEDIIPVSRKYIPDVKNYFIRLPKT